MTTPTPITTAGLYKLGFEEEILEVWAKVEFDFFVKEVGGKYYQCNEFGDILLKGKPIESIN